MTIELISRIIKESIDPNQHLIIRGLESHLHCQGWHVASKISAGNAIIIAIAIENKIETNLIPVIIPIGNKEESGGEVVDHLCRLMHLRKGNFNQEIRSDQIPIVIMTCNSSWRSVSQVFHKYADRSAIVLSLFDRTNQEIPEYLTNNRHEYYYFARSPLKTFLEVDCPECSYLQIPEPIVSYHLPVEVNLPHFTSAIA